MLKVYRVATYVVIVDEAGDIVEGRVINDIVLTDNDGTARMLGARAARKTAAEKFIPTLYGGHRFSFKATVLAVETVADEPVIDHRIAIVMVHPLA